MYTQFFGTYLLSSGCVTPEQLFSAMLVQEQEHMKLGTLAIHAGYINANQVDEIVIQQTHHDRKFGELAIEMGYLTEEQVAELLSKQTPSYLMIGQALLDAGVLTNTTFEKLIRDYHEKNEMAYPPVSITATGTVQKLFRNFLDNLKTPLTTNGDSYVMLLMNNLIRFIGDDFTPLTIESVSEFPIKCCVTQGVLGAYSVQTYIATDHSTAISFASRYVKEPFSEFDEYVQASLEDFLNLQNGLFIVNVSNDTSIELTLDPPQAVDAEIMHFHPLAIHIPVMYSFGTIDFVCELLRTPELCIV